jgi:hypothetical protein
VGRGRGRLLGDRRSRSLRVLRVCCGGRLKILRFHDRDGVQETLNVVLDRFVDLGVLDFWSDAVCFRDGCCVGDGGVAIVIASLDFVNVFGGVLRTLCAPCQLSGLRLYVLEVVTVHLDYCDASPSSHRRLSPLCLVFQVQITRPSIYPPSRPPFVSSWRRHHRDHSQHLLCLALRRSQVLSIVLWSRLSLSLVARHYDYPHF